MTGLCSEIGAMVFSKSYLFSEYLDDVSGRLDLLIGAQSGAVINGLLLST
jgi:hypothetical protein